ncbi:MAG: hypothetical protein ACR2OH_00585, partial [Microthrixaceae bacterium]
MSGCVAAIDMGTNTTRLLVARPVPPGQLETVARESHITRMGQDVDATGVLHRDAIGRVVERLQ